ncbi:unnamed protein product [Cylicocyclus nassatus]|uniref:SCP domain-containing protein n=1 Tax=Cylicocyclus nassatus TaxID=53992 RepID=A0AA36GKL2_CYLNA|nr:unnamed protein product [Cylicocyclus nassatus]
MLQVLLFCFTFFQALRIDMCNVAPEVGEAVVKAHNAIRAQVATRGLYKKIFGDAPGSKSLFKLGYDRSHAALAAAVIGSRCKHSKIYMSSLQKSENYKIYRTNGPPNNETLLQFFLYAVEDWRDTVNHPLRPDVKYADTSMEPFANMIYHKTLKFGCAYRFCKSKSKVALACVYDNRPVLDEPLYLADSMNKKGCVRDYPCKKIISNAVCEKEGDKTGPLCEVPQPIVQPIIEHARTTLSPNGYPSFTLPPALPGGIGSPARPGGIGYPALPGGIGSPALPGGIGSPALPGGIGFSRTPEMREHPQSGLPINLEACQVQQIAGLPAYILRCQDYDENRQGTVHHQARPSTFICDVQECPVTAPGCQGGKYQLLCQQQQQQQQHQQYNPSQIQNPPLRCNVNQQRFQAAQQYQAVLPTLVCQQVQPQNGFMVQGMNPGVIPPNSYNVVYNVPFSRTSNLNESSTDAFHG